MVWFETQINSAGSPGFVRQCQRRKEGSESGFTVGATFVLVFDEARIQRVLSKTLMPVIGGASCVTGGRSMFALLMGLKTISPDELHQLIQKQQVTVIDVNSRHSWIKARVQGVKS